MYKSINFYQFIVFIEPKKFIFVLSSTALTGQMPKKAQKITVYYKCEQCNQFFEHTFRPQKYCSESCRRKNKYNKTGK
jgi:hypothetical protein